MESDQLVFPYEHLQSLKTASAQPQLQPQQQPKDLSPFRQRFPWYKFQRDHHDKKYEFMGVDTEESLTPYFAHFSIMKSPVAKKLKLKTLIEARDEIYKDPRSFDKVRKLYELNSSISTKYDYVKSIVGQAFLPVGLGKPNLTANEAFDLLFPTKPFFTNKKSPSQGQQINRQDSSNQDSFQDEGQSESTMEQIRASWFYKRTNLEYHWFMSRAYQAYRHHFLRHNLRINQSQLQDMIKREMFDECRPRKVLYQHNPADLNISDTQYYHYFFSAVSQNYDLILREVAKIDKEPYKADQVFEFIFNERTVRMKRINYKGMVQNLMQGTEVPQQSLKAMMSHQMDCHRRILYDYDFRTKKQRINQIKGLSAHFQARQQIKILPLEQVNEKDCPSNYLMVVLSNSNFEIFGHHSLQDIIDHCQVESTKCHFQRASLSQDDVRHIFKWIKLMNDKGWLQKVQINPHSFVYQQRADQDSRLIPNWPILLSKLLHFDAIPKTAQQLVAYYTPTTDIDLYKAIDDLYHRCLTETDQAQTKMWASKHLQSYDFTLIEENNWNQERSQRRNSFEEYLKLSKKVNEARQRLVVSEDKESKIKEVSNIKLLQNSRGKLIEKIYPNDEQGHQELSKLLQKAQNIENRLDKSYTVDEPEKIMKQAFQLDSEITNKLSQKISIKCHNHTSLDILSESTSKDDSLSVYQRLALLKISMISQQIQQGKSCLTLLNGEPFSFVTHQEQKTLYQLMFMLLLETELLSSEEMQVKLSELFSHFYMKQIVDIVKKYQDYVQSYLQCDKKTAKILQKSNEAIKQALYDPINLHLKSTNAQQHQIGLLKLHKSLCFFLQFIKNQPFDHNLIKELQPSKEEFRMLLECQKEIPKSIYDFLRVYIDILGDNIQPGKQLHILETFLKENYPFLMTKEASFQEKNFEQLQSVSKTTQKIIHSGIRWQQHLIRQQLKGRFKGDQLEPKFLLFFLCSKSDFNLKEEIQEFKNIGTFQSTGKKLTHHYQFLLTQQLLELVESGEKKQSYNQKQQQRRQLESSSKEKPETLN